MAVAAEQSREKLWGKCVCPGKYYNRLLGLHPSSGCNLVLHNLLRKLQGLETARVSCLFGSRRPTVAAKVATLSTSGPPPVIAVAPPTGGSPYSPR